MPDTFQQDSWWKSFFFFSLPLTFYFLNNVLNFISRLAVLLKKCGLITFICWLIERLNRTKARVFVL